MISGESDTSAKGACLCGAIRFEFDLPTNWVAHCHCSMCRRAHGAPFVTWVSVPKASFRILHGAASLVRYESSPGAARSFCGNCGSTLLFESTRWAGEVHLTRANIEGALDQNPGVHAFFSDKADWLEFHDELPRRGGPTGIEPL